MNKLIIKNQKQSLTLFLFTCSIFMVVGQHQDKLLSTFINSSLIFWVNFYIFCKFDCINLKKTYYNLLDNFSSIMYTNKPWKMHVQNMCLKIFLIFYKYMTTQLNIIIFFKFEPSSFTKARILFFNSYSYKRLVRNFANA